MTTAPLFGVLPRSTARWLGMGLVLGVLTCGLVVTVLWLQRPDSGSAAGGYTADANEEPINKEFRAHRFERLERRQVQRYGLQKIDQQSVRIWQDIAVFEAEATNWREKFQDLLTSDTGKKLKGDPWVVRYFWDQWKQKLPNPEVAGDHRDNLNTLMLSIKECLKEETTAYAPSQVLRDEIDQIETNVKAARDMYNRHRRLLDALVGMLENEMPVDQETLRDSVEQFDGEMILTQFDYLPPSNVGSTGPTPARVSAPHEPVESAAATRGGLDELHDQATRQLEDQRDYGRSTQIRDAVKGRPNGER